MEVFNNSSMNKIQYLSISRVVATLFIVICHIIPYFHFLPGHEYLGQFFNVGVEMFLIISGCLYGYKHIKEKFRRYYLKRLLKVALPVQIFALFLFLILGRDELEHTIIVLLNLQGLGFIFDLQTFDIGKTIAVNNNLSHTWFVTVILACYLLIPFLHRIRSKFKAVHLLFVWTVTLSVTFLGVNLNYFTMFLTGFFIISNNYFLSCKYRYLFFSFLGALSLRLLTHMFFDDTIFYTGVIVMLSHTIIAISIILFIKEFTSRNTNVTASVTSNAVFKKIEIFSFYIYITHYCLIIPLFHNYGIGLATVLFLLGSLALAFLLREVHLFMERKMKKMILRKA